MKSPWKYLVDLAARRTAKETDGPPDIEERGPETFPLAPAGHALEARGVDGIAAGSFVETENAAVTNLDAAALDTANTAVDQRVEAPTPSLDQSSADDREDLSQPPRPPLRAKRQSSGAKTNADNIAVSDVVEYRGDSSGARPAPITFIDEVTALDAEIEHLRRELAAKLLLQNAQLKTMLERYNAPP